MITIHVVKGTAGADQIKKLIKDKGLGKQVKIQIHETGPEQPVLVGLSGEYKGVNKITSYLRGYFK